jgi:hypothetical protein
MKLVNETYGTIEYDASVPCITATFNAYMPSDLFRDFLERGLKHLIEKKKIHRRLLWLADTSNHSVQPDKDIKWVAEEWNPRALAAGINHVAFVLPEKAFAVRAVHNYREKSKDQAEMTVEFFGKLEDAKEWFRTLEPATSTLK